jgi:hypothetical protein
VSTTAHERLSPARTQVRSRALAALGVICVIGVAVLLLAPVIGKPTHAVVPFCATFAFGWLLLGWRDRVRADLADELATLATIFAGVLFGVLWEIVEFVRDWVAYSDLQQSNTDTMTDFLVTDVFAVLAALLAVRLYCRTLASEDRGSLGAVAEWLVDGPSKLLDRHGLALTVIVACAIAVAVASLWFAGRPMPGISIP